MSVGVLKFFVASKCKGFIEFCPYYILLLNADVNNEEVDQIFYCKQDDQIADNKTKTTTVIVSTTTAIALIVIIIILILVVTCCWRRYKLQSMHVAV